MWKRKSAKRKQSYRGCKKCGSMNGFIYATRSELSYTYCRECEKTGKQSGDPSGKL